MKKLIFSSLIAMLLLNLCAIRVLAQSDKVYSHISLKNPPSYPGGIKQFYDFMGKTIIYPKKAAANSIQGTAYVSFIIEKDGSITDVKTTERKLGYGLDEEAIRAVKLSKKWNPGILDGKPVRVQYNLPIKFSMDKSTSKNVTKEQTNAPVQLSKADDKDQRIYNHAALENPPTYPGGIKQFYNFLGKTISYPKDAVESKAQGTAFVNFTIEKDGSITDVKAMDKKLGFGLDEEAIRVVKLSKKWNPGIQDGKPVRVKYSLPIKFSMK